jgi:hypothetical protein
MNAAELPSKSALYLADTHEVVNVARELADYNPYLEDAALQEAVRREGAAAAHQSLAEFGSLVGTAEYIELGAVANRVPPELDTHDRFGNRVDLVRVPPRLPRADDARRSSTACIRRRGPSRNPARTWRARRSATCTRRSRPATAAR